MLFSLTYIGYYHILPIRSGLLYRSAPINICYQYIFTLGQFWPSVVVLACLWLCVNHKRMRTCHLFKLEPPNLDQRCKTPLSKISIVLGVDRPWPSGSNLTSKSRYHYVCFVHQSKYTTTRVNIKTIFDSLQFFHRRDCLVLHDSTFLTHWGRDKWPPFSRRHLQMHFLEWKCINYD